MKFFVDTANLNEIKTAHSLGILDGVTTNPSLMAKEGIKGKDAVMQHYKAICDIVENNVSAEVLSTTYNEMMAEADELYSICPEKIVIKVPITKDGLKVIKHLSDKGIRTNCTLIFSPAQALLAAKAGANFVSPFLGRLDDISHDGLQLIEEIRCIFNNYMMETEILAASIRSPLHITKCAMIGADVITSPLDSILKLLQHPLTENGLNRFIKDSENLR